MRPLYHQIDPVQASVEYKSPVCLKSFISDADPFIFKRSKGIDDVTVNIGNESSFLCVLAPFHTVLANLTHSGPQHWSEVSGPQYSGSGWMEAG
jgi:hypothetical protein